MSWLLELLLDGFREICSQFIVDMMELITEMFTELLSCNLSLFEELFSVVGALYANVIVPMGVAILLLILIWQLFKSMFGKSVNSEEPIELIIRSAIALFFVIAAKPIVNYILRFAGTPYQWVVGTEIKVSSFSGFVSALEGVTETLGIGKLSISILMLIMQFVVAWNYFKMLFIIAERYVLLGVFSYTAPLAFATGGSKSTNNILASWSKMFGGQVVLIILNAWCMKMFLSGYGNMMASSYGFTKFFVATLCLVGFCKITFKLDTYMASLGVNLGRPSPGMGAMGLLMSASRVLSQIGRGSTGDNGGSAPSSSDNSGAVPGSNMTSGFAGPIPMTAGVNYSAPIDLESEVSNGDFDTVVDDNAGSQSSGESNYSSEKAEGNSVLDELGIVNTVSTSNEGSGTGSNNAAGTRNGNNQEGEFSIGDGTTIGSFEEDTPMDTDFSGMPAYGSESNPENGMGLIQAEKAGSENVVSAESRNGNDSGGIISEIGDYPVEREDPEDMDAYDMDIDGSMIGSGAEMENVSYGSAGDAYGNHGLASRNSKSSGSFSHGEAIGNTAATEGVGAAGGIISEVVSNDGAGESGFLDQDIAGDTFGFDAAASVRSNKGSVGGKTDEAAGYETENIGQMMKEADPDRSLSGQELDQNPDLSEEISDEMSEAMPHLNTDHHSIPTEEQNGARGQDVKGFKEVPRSREELHQQQDKKR